MNRLQAIINAKKQKAQEAAAPAKPQAPEAAMALAQAPAPAPTPTDQPAPQEEPTSIDTNGDGVISPDELFASFDADGDGKIDMIDYTAHILFHIMNPGLLRPYMTEAHNKLHEYKDRVANIHGKLKETLLVSKDDPQGNDKVKQALQKGEDVSVLDKNKINQFKLKEHFQTLAGIIK